MLLLEYLLCYLGIDVDKKGKKVEFNQLKGFECDIWTVCARESSGRLLAILCHQHLGNQLDVYVCFKYKSYKSLGFIGGAWAYKKCERKETKIISFCVCNLYLSA